MKNRTRRRLPTGGLGPSTSHAGNESGAAYGAAIDAAGAVLVFVTIGGAAGPGDGSDLAAGLAARLRAA